MRKTEKKPVTKASSGVKLQEAKPADVSVPVEEKPKVMFEPVVEEVAPVAGVEVKPSEVVSVAPAASETASPPVELVKPEVPAGELARSIDTLAKIVDDSKTGTEEKVQITDRSVKRNEGGGTLGMILAFIVGLCLGIVVGYVLWGRFVIGGVEVISEKEPVIISEDQTVKVSPTVSPVPEAAALKRTDLKIKVLNGTGGKGVAAAGKTYLESLGYTSVEVGNAKRSDYTKTEVILAKDKTAFWELLKKDLSAKYSLVDGFSTDEELLAASAGVDALVIVGAE